MLRALVLSAAVVGASAAGGASWKDALAALRTKVAKRGSASISAQFSALDNAVVSELKLGDAAATWRHTAEDSRAGLELSDAVDSRAQFCSTYSHKRRMATSKVIHKLVNLDVFMSQNQWSTCTHAMDPTTAKALTTLDDPEAFVQTMVVFAAEMARRFPQVAAMKAFTIFQKYAAKSGFLTKDYTQHLSAHLVDGATPPAPLGWIDGLSKCVRGEALLACEKRDAATGACTASSAFTQHVGKTGNTAIFLRHLVQKFASLAIDLDTAMYYARLTREVPTIARDGAKSAASAHEQSCDDLFAHSEELRFDEIDRSELIASDEFALQELAELTTAL